ncbi:Penicillin amidase family protein [Rhodovulum sp. P5]|uniref:penicillin acylase family protein n=1 Tax=Rhodovulum sp. P5 TaxID=1564506 RepID=UPI0009C20A60|nr:penicillin acylase family protein [Rhodovulum sp. P5]ARE38403.1 Penicillin amidase family protein [Rhodovulum sp. P5]
MSILFRWLLRLFIGTALVVLIALAGVYFLASRSLPDFDATHRVAGLSAPVEIVRDNANVPHLLGETDEDVFFALGFVHAQDRLWQMTVLRRTAQGRLSELFGTRTLRVDEFLRRLDIYGLSRSSVNALEPETLAALEAYARGVNAWIATVNRDARGRGAPEFFLFPPEVAYWQPADSIAIMKLMSLQMSDQLDIEVLRARVSLLLDEARVRDLLPDAPGTGLMDLPDYAELAPGVLPDTAPVHRLAGTTFTPLAQLSLSGASNSWAAAPRRSAAGGTLLANDPHLGLSAPSIWYLARLELSSGGVIGGTIPGIPAIFAGRSAKLGWGLTASYMDDQDVFLERLNPDNPQEYLTPDGYKPFETRRSILKVAGEDPVTITMRWTENGPVLPGSHFDLASVTPPGHVAALGWTLLDGADTSIQSILKLMRAGSVSEAIEATRDHVAPSVNVMLADKDTIALQMAGTMPRRLAGNQSQGRLPVPGWKTENRWHGALNAAANPSVIAPESGILGNTNNKLVERPFPLHVSYHWGDTQRIQRWRRLMESREVHTRESFIEAQLDTVSFTARALLPLIGRDLWFTGEPAERGTPERRRQQALELLAEWNGEMNEHLPEPLIYAAWIRELQNELIRDDLGPLADAFTHVEPLFIERVFRNVDGAAAWCDIRQSAVIETCTEISRRSLDKALLWLSETYGPSLSSLRWGEAHEARHDHPVLGEVPVLKWFVNIRQSTSGGDNTLNRGLTKGTDPAPFANVFGAGYRGVYDFADPDSSVFIISTGQSGHPLSRYYDDLGELWRRGEYIPMTLDLDLARAAAVGVTKLLPQK